MSDSVKSVKLFWLLDNNVFRNLTSSPDGVALRTLNDALERLPLLRNGDLTALKMTPMGVLEALGVVPPGAPPIRIGPAMVHRPAHEVAEHLLTQFKNFLAKSVILSRSSLEQAAEAQRKFTTYEAQTLFDICVMHPINTAGFHETVLTCIAFDYLYKFQFPRPLTREMHHFFVAGLFSTKGLASHLGKFRVARRMWEELYPKLLAANPGREHHLELYNRSMSIKNARDYLDCDIVHFLSIGYDTGADHLPVAVFTQDDLHVLVDRVSVFKSVLHVTRSLLTAEARAQLSPDALNHEGGVIIHCTEDCKIDACVPVAKIPALL
jgi:hypothetical protein